MLDNFLKGDEKTDTVPVAPTPVTQTPVTVVKTAPAPKVCTNCEGSGLTCIVCGYNKP
jgi:hypothetical protein